MKLRENNLSVKKKYYKAIYLPTLTMFTSIFQRFSDAYAKYAGDALFSYTSIYHLDHVRIKVGSKVA